MCYLGFIGFDYGKLKNLKICCGGVWVVQRSIINQCNNVHDQGAGLSNTFLFLTIGYVTGYHKYITVKLASSFRN